MGKLRHRAPTTSMWQNNEWPKSGCSWEMTKKVQAGGTMRVSRLWHFYTGAQILPRKLTPWQLTPAMCSTEMQSNGFSRAHWTCPDPLWLWQTGAVERGLDGTSGHPSFMVCLFQLFSYVSLGSVFLIYKMGELEKVVCCMSFLSTSSPVQPSILLLICQHNLVCPGT